MKPVFAQVRIEMELNGPDAGWADLTADLRAEPSLRLQYGIQGMSPNDRVASTGSLSFALDNADTNSGRRLGYYSPNHRNVRPGFRLGVGVRLVLVYEGTRYYKWRGTLDSIQ